MFKFNLGQGAVICNQCKIMIDKDLSYKEYEEIYEKNNPDGDFCWRCKTKPNMTQSSQGSNQTKNK